MTAKAMRQALIDQKGWKPEALPCEKTIEAHWSGTILNCRDTVLEWARTMTWNAIHPVVQLLDGVYETGVKIARKAFRPIARRLKRDEAIPKYSVKIEPQLA